MERSMQYAIILEYPGEMPDVFYFTDLKEYEIQRNRWLLRQSEGKHFNMGYGVVTFRKVAE